MSKIEPSLFPSDESLKTVQKLAPNSQESEEATLGSVLINPETLPELRAFLAGDDFYYMHHRFIWDAFIAVAERGEDIDALTVVEDLRYKRDRDGQTYLEKVGGSSYITYLINNTPTHTHAETYGRIVERLAVRRRLLDAASSIAQAALADDIELETAIERSETALKLAVEQRTPLDMPEDAGDVAEARFDTLTKIVEGTIENPIVSTGFAMLDDLMADGGFAPGSVYYIAGRPSMGKTALLASFVKAGVMAGHLTYFASLEMSKSEVADRLLSGISGVDSMKIKRASMTFEEWNSVRAAKETIKSWKTLKLDDKSGMTLTEIKAKARKLARAGKLKALYIDYLQIMGTSDVRVKNGNRMQDITEITKGFKEFAKELGIFLVVAVQVNRGPESRADHKPNMGDMRESDSIAFDADGIIAPFRPDYYSEKTDSAVESIIQDMEVLVLKMRNGRMGSLPAQFISNTVDIVPAARKPVVSVANYMSTGMVEVDGKSVDPHDLY